MNSAVKYYRRCFAINGVEKSRQAVVSREAKKKLHACASSDLRNHYNELFARMATVKL